MVSECAAVAFAHQSYLNLYGEEKPLLLITTLLHLPPTVGVRLLIDKVKSQGTDDVFRFSSPGKWILFRGYLQLKR